MSEPIELRIAHLYARFLNIYGDRGNILALQKRAEWRAIKVSITRIGLNESFDADFFDFYFIGGGQDKQQETIAVDLLRHRQRLARAKEGKAVILAVCGGYQLLGNYYRPAEGHELKGISLIDAYTVAGQKRMIGNVIVKRPDSSTIVGFENHSGKTYLGPGVEALGKVVVGWGNNGEDKHEGAVDGSIYGTYLHGSLLPKNPRLTDELIGAALSRRYPDIELAELDDSLELKAHKKALALPQ